MRTHLFLWDGVVYKQQERFFVLTGDFAEVTDASWDQAERDVLREWRWWTLDEIARSDDLFGPRGLAALLPPILEGNYPSEPLLDGLGFSAEKIAYFKGQRFRIGRRFASCSAATAHGRAGSWICLGRRQCWLVV
jgi:hypothetical protein